MKPEVRERLEQVARRLGEIPTEKIEILREPYGHWFLRGLESGKEIRLGRFQRRRSPLQVLAELEGELFASKPKKDKPMRTLDEILDSVRKEEPIGYEEAVAALAVLDRIGIEERRGLLYTTQETRRKAIKARVAEVFAFGDNAFTSPPDEWIAKQNHARKKED